MSSKEDLQRQVWNLSQTVAELLHTVQLREAEKDLISQEVLRRAKEQHTVMLVAGESKPAATAQAAAATPTPAPLKAAPISSQSSSQSSDSLEVNKLRAALELAKYQKEAAEKKTAMLHEALEQRAQQLNETMDAEQELKEQVRILSPRSAAAQGGGRGPQAKMLQEALEKQNGVVKETKAQLRMVLLLLADDVRGTLTLVEELGQLGKPTTSFWIPVCDALASLSAEKSWHGLLRASARLASLRAAFHKIDPVFSVSLGEADADEVAEDEKRFREGHGNLEKLVAWVSAKLERLNTIAVSEAVNALDGVVSSNCVVRALLDEPRDELIKLLHTFDAVLENCNAVELFKPLTRMVFRLFSERLMAKAFNHMVDTPSDCTASHGYRIKSRLAMLSAWFEGTHVNEAYASFSPMEQVAELLTVDRMTFLSTPTSVCEKYDKLNASMIHALTRNVKGDQVKQDPVPKDAVEALAAHAAQEPGASHF